MKPVESVSGGLFVTVVILFGLGFLASQVAISSDEEAEVTPVAAEPEPAFEFEAIGLRVEILDVRNDEGRVIAAVFDSEEAFAQYDFERAAAYAELPAEIGTIEAHFAELTEGPYAVILFHDENEDYELNMDGPYPVEGYGTSGAEDPYDEPTFEEAAFNPGRVAVHMYYLR